MQHIALLVGALAALATGALALADTGSTSNVEQRIASLEQELTRLREHAAGLEARLATAESVAAATRTALSRELAQPMLLLVGTGPCPAKFKRIDVHALMLTRQRTEETGPLLDEAGLTYEDPQGVGYNAFRGFSFCFRPGGSTSLE